MMGTGERVSGQIGQMATGTVSVYEPAQLIRKWEQEELTAEQAIGQTLLYIDSLLARIQQLERRVEKEN